MFTLSIPEPINALFAIFVTELGITAFFVPKDKVFVARSIRQPLSTL